MKFVSLFVLAVLVFGCVSTGTKETVQPPAAMESYFSICSPLDGALILKVFDDGDLLGSSEMDWISSENGWKIDLSNAAGFSLASIVQSGRSLKVSGNQAKRIPPMSVDEEGFLEIDGNFVGIKASEVPCLLHSVLPRSWQPFIYAVEGKQDDRLTLHAEDERRTIVVKAKNLGDASKEELCADISWRNKLIFGSTLRWCVSGSGLKKGEISGVKSYSVKWVRFDG